MKAHRFLIFGTPEDLASPLVQKLQALGEAEWVVQEQPDAASSANFEGAVLVWREAELSRLESWASWAKQHALPVVIYGEACPIAVRAAFVPRAYVPVEEPHKVLESFLFPDASHVSLVEPGSALDPFADLISDKGATEQDPLPTYEVAAVSDLSLESVEKSVAKSEDVSEAEMPFEASSLAESEPSPSEDLWSSPAAAESVGVAAQTGWAQMEEVGENAGGEALAPQVSAEDPFSAEAASGSVVEESAQDPDWAVAEEPSSAQSGGSAEVVASDPLEEVDRKVEPWVASAPMPSLPGTGGSSSSEEYQTLQRYAALKDRELREKEGALQVLNRQLDQVRERLSRSESERRKLTLEMDEVQAIRRSLEDNRDQAKHHLEKLEATHQEELRALQLRLDNAQFQASKFERKLEDFREKVKTDIQKIRSRERELANRLELQKRDAEALLAAKDERLLQQKRDLDRYAFEIDSLRERLVEQTQKAEERVGRLSRALKALKMAQGMLSGLDDEVLPGIASGAAVAESGDEGDGEEAA